MATLRRRSGFWLQRACVVTKSLSGSAKPSAKDSDKFLVSHLSLGVLISCVFTPIGLWPRVFVPCAFPLFFLLFFALLLQGIE